MCVCVCVCVCMCVVCVCVGPVCTHARMHACTRMDGCMDGWMEGFMDVWMYGWMYIGCIYRQIQVTYTNIQSHTYIHQNMFPSSRPWPMATDSTRICSHLSSNFCCDLQSSHGTTFFDATPHGLRLFNNLFPRVQDQVQVRSLRRL